MYRRHVAAQAVFAAGLFLTLLGAVFLLGSMAGISRLSVLWSFLFMSIGAFCAALALKRGKRALYLFFASFFILVGLFLFLSALRIIPVSLAQGWPLLSVFAGLALLPAGWRHYRAFRYRFLIPSLAFVILGCALSIFSFKVVSFSFRLFIIHWWPLLIVLAGMVLVLLSLSSKSRNGDEVS
ncbi:MAG: DUF5668 domain-containing protein [Treponema sp.]|jgi:hypothetical protein|nr:DUF5668 domain-containing protein [Treponema sp.]